MGGSRADESTRKIAYQLGRLIATQGWVLLNGGRASGVMDASAKGARDAGGLVIGVLPDTGPGKESAFLDIRIYTGLHHARNLVNVLSSDIVFACRGEAGTLSEIALALSNAKKVITVGWNAGESFHEYEEQGLIIQADDPDKAIEIAKDTLPV
ncbi:MAG: TIGR00725 family protein [Deltaproteobacteria bacterium]|nr:TIGR00725 family protein [Deltaproteobacteria bacterium]